MSLAISAHIGHFAYITMRICVGGVCVFKKPSKTDAVQRIRILCCCLLANFNLRWFHLRSGGGWVDVGKGGRKYGISISVSNKKPEKTNILIKYKMDASEVEPLF